MKYIFTFLILALSASGFSFSLNKKEYTQAFLESRGKADNTFFYELVDDPAQREITAKDKNFYGPYRLVLKDVSDGMKFALYGFNLLEVEKPFLYGFGYIENGEAWIGTEKGYISLTNWYHTMGNLAKGEPMFAMMVLDDGKSNTYRIATIVPNKLEAYGEKGEHVQMEILVARFPMYLVTGSNFNPREEIQVTMKTIEWTELKNIVVKEDGSFRFLIERKKSKKLGVENMEVIIDQSAKPVITIAYDWNFLEPEGKKFNNKIKKIKGKEKQYK